MSICRSNIDQYYWIGRALRFGQVAVKSMETFIVEFSESSPPITLVVGRAGDCVCVVCMLVYELWII